MAYTRCVRATPLHGNTFSQAPTNRLNLQPLQSPSYKLFRVVGAKGRTTGPSGCHRPRLCGDNFTNDCIQGLHFLCRADGGTPLQLSRRHPARIARGANANVFVQGIRAGLSSRFITTVFNQLSCASTAQETNVQWDKQASLKPPYNHVFQAHHLACTCKHVPRSRYGFRLQRLLSTVLQYRPVLQIQYTLLPVRFAV